MRPYVGRHERPLGPISTDHETVRRDAAERIGRPGYTPRHAGGGAAKP